MPREREEKAEQEKRGEEPAKKKASQADVADIDRESSQPEASNHKGTAGDVYGR